MKLAAGAFFAICLALSVLSLVGTIGTSRENVRLRDENTSLRLDKVKLSTEVGELSKNYAELKKSDVDLQRAVDRVDLESHLLRQACGKCCPLFHGF